jgi:hypothetical protein
MNGVGGSHAPKQLMNVAPGEEAGVREVNVVLLLYHRPFFRSLV